jgi:hypothetical protein
MAPASTPIPAPVELSPGQIERMHRLGGAWRLLDADRQGALLLERVDEHASAWVARDGRLEHAAAVIPPVDADDRFVADWHSGPAGPRRPV